MKSKVIYSARAINIICNRSVFLFQTSLASASHSIGIVAAYPFHGTLDNIYVPSLKTATLPIHEFHVIDKMRGICYKFHNGF